MKKIWINKARSFKEAEKFDIQFWKKAGVQARFSATWKMVEELYKIRGVYGYKLRLRRSVQNIKKNRTVPNLPEWLECGLRVRGVPLGNVPQKKRVR